MKFLCNASILLSFVEIYLFNSSKLSITGKNCDVKGLFLLFFGLYYDDYSYGAELNHLWFLLMIVAGISFISTFVGFLFCLHMICYGCLGTWSCGTYLDYA